MFTGQNFGFGSAGDGGGSIVSASTESLSKYLLTDTSDVFTFNGPVARDVNNKQSVLLYSMPPGNLTDVFDPVTKAGQMATAVITKPTNFDNIVVGSSANPENSYVFANQQINAVNKYTVRVKFRINSIGANPRLGVRPIFAGAPYCNSDNGNFWMYANLINGAITSNAVTIVDSFNNVQNSVAAGSIVTIEYEMLSLNNYRFTYRLNGNLNEVSVLGRSYPDGSNTNNVLSFPAIIMEDGDYDFLEWNICADIPVGCKALIDGDSMGSGFRANGNQRIVSYLQARLPFNCESKAGPGIVTAGIVAAQYQLLQLKPQYVLLFCYIDSIFSAWSNPANPNYATYNGFITGYVNLLRQIGAKIIFVHPETWDGLGNAAQCQVYTDYLNNQWPDELKLFVPTAQIVYDSSGFHYAASTNSWIADQAIEIMENDGGL
jgi:hypothetical protein